MVIVDGLAAFKWQMGAVAVKAVEGDLSGARTKDLKQARGEPGFAGATATGDSDQDGA